MRASLWIVPVLMRATAIATAIAATPPMLASCSSDKMNLPADTIDGGTPDRSVDDDLLPKLDVEIEVIDGVGIAGPNAGDNAVLLISPQGTPTAVYASLPQSATRRDIMLATRASNGTWTSEKVVTPGQNEANGGDIVGLGFAYVGNIPHVVYLGGDGDGRPTSPFPSDLMLSTKTGAAWTERTLVDTSGEAPGTCPGTQNTCNVGNVVGSHPSIRAHPSGSGFSVVYRDTHFGFAKDDYELADVEIYEERGAGITRTCVDPVRSGGANADLTNNASGNLVLAYNLEAPATGQDRVGVWAAAFAGATWALTRVWTDVSASKVKLVTASDGMIYLVFNPAGNSDLVVATSSDGGKSWPASSVTVIESAGKTGLHPSITLDALDRPAIAYTYCGRQEDRDCPGTLGSQSEVRLARLENGEWRRYSVQTSGYAGLFTSIAKTSEGTLGIIYKNDRSGDLIYAREK